MKQLLARKELHQKMEQRYQQQEEAVLQERKKKLAEIRAMNKPINLQ